MGQAILTNLLNKVGLKKKENKDRDTTYSYFRLKQKVEYLQESNAYLENCINFQALPPDDMERLKASRQYKKLLKKKLNLLKRCKQLEFENALMRQALGFKNVDDREQRRAYEAELNKLSKLYDIQLED